MRKIFTLLFLFSIFVPSIVLASEAYVKIETNFKGNGSVYQYAEAIVDDQTIKSEFILNQITIFIEQFLDKILKFSKNLT